MADTLKRAAAFLILLFAAMVFPAILGGADEVGDGQPPVLLEWPMLPGESLRQLAKLIYPRDGAMQRIFVTVAMRENPATFPGHGADQRFDQETLIWLPDLKQLANLATSSSTPRHFLRPALPAMQPSVSGAAPSRLQISPALENQSSETVQPTHPAAGVHLAPAANIRNLNAAPAYDAAAMMAIETLVARNQTLKEEQDRLSERISNLAASISAMSESIMGYRNRSLRHAGPVPAVPAVPVKPAPGAAANTFRVDFLFQPSILYPLTGAAVFLSGAAIWWLRRRHKSEQPAAALGPAATEAFKPTVAINPTSLDYGDVATPIHIEENFVDDGFISVDEVACVVEESKVFVALGRSERAIEVLGDYITTHPRASANPWLYLMEIYRSANRKEDFVELANRFHQSLNVIAPQWETQSQMMLVVPHSLQEFPHILARLTESWGTLDAQDFLNHLLQDNRGGERQGFSMEVLEEILLLLAILELRDHLSALKPF